MGLAVGIDYSLFIVSRYREERRGGREQLDAIDGGGRHGQPGRALQRDDGRARAGGDADRADEDLRQPRRRRDPGGAGRRASRRSRCCRPSSACSATGSSRCACRSSGAWPPRARARRRRLVADRRQVMRRPVVALVATVAVLLVAAIPYTEHPHGLLGRLEPARQRPGQAGIPDPEPRLLRRRRHPGRDRRRRRDHDAGRPAGVPAARAASSPATDRFGPLRPEPHPAQAAGGDQRGGRRRSQLQRGPERRPRPAQRLPAGGAARQRAARLRGRRERAEPRLLRDHRPLPADRLRARARAELRAAHARVPVDRRPRVEHRHEPALGGRRLRVARPGHAAGLSAPACSGSSRCRSSRRGSRSSCSRCCSACPWTTRCSCSRASASATTRAATAARRSPTASARPHS